MTINDSGYVPAHYIDKMKGKPDVVVMKVRNKDITILQRGERFEIFIPENENVVH